MSGVRTESIPSSFNTLRIALLSQIPQKAGKNPRCLLRLSIDPSKAGQVQAVCVEVPRGALERLFGDGSSEHRRKPRK